MPCASWVRARPVAENKGVNRRYNHATGQHLGAGFFTGDTWQANRLIAPRVDGNFTGTPQEILRWAACKWGIDQDIVFAQAAEKSSWPGISRSTAMNADTAYAIWRACFDGYETWLNTVTHVGAYRGGDAWG